MKLNKQDRIQIQKNHEWLSDILSRRIQDRLELLPDSDNKELDAEVIKELKEWKIVIEEIRDAMHKQKDTGI